MLHVGTGIIFEINTLRDVRMVIVFENEPLKYVLEAIQFEMENLLYASNVSQIVPVRDYIAGQEEHHRKVSFQDEFRLLLKRYEIEFDERYLWD